MTWWGWLIVGIGLMGAEVLTDAAFYLLFAGAAALVVGLAGLAGVPLPIWAQWLAFSVLTVISVVAFRRALHERLRGGLPGFPSAEIGRDVTTTEAVPPGGRTRVRLRGSWWTAVNTGRTAIAAGDRARVVGIDGVDLRIDGSPPPDPAAR